MSEFNNEISMLPGRRAFLRALGGAALGAIGPAGAGHSQIHRPFGTPIRRRPAALPPPHESGIEHIVVVTMENRSFDHLLGWLPGADGRQAGLSYSDSTGAVHSTYPLAPDYTGCGHPDPDHSYDQSRIAHHDGAMDGFLRAGRNDRYSIGYYAQPDLPLLSALAQSYLVCDRYFASILGPTFPNRMFLWAAQTDRLDNRTAISGLTTIFDRLAAAGVSHRYYFNNAPYVLLWGIRYLFDSSPFSAFLDAAGGGTLPAVSYVDPVFTVTDDGTGNDDHPHADVRNGEAFLATVVQALAKGPAWRNTVLVILFDEWGGFFEHVAPPRMVPGNQIDPDQVNGQVLLGFRVPALIVSPFTRRRGRTPAVNHALFDHTSVLKLIEWRWGLVPLTPRDASPQIGNLAQAMDFRLPDVRVPALPMAFPVNVPGCFQPESRDTFSPRQYSPPRRGPWAALANMPGAQEWMRRAGLSRY